MKQALEQGAFQEGGNGGRVRDSPTLKVIMMMLLGVMIMIITIYIYTYIYNMYKLYTYIDASGFALHGCRGQPAPAAGWPRVTAKQRSSRNWRSAALRCTDVPLNTTKPGCWWIVGGVSNWILTGFKPQKGMTVG